MQYLSLQRAKALLQQRHSILETALETGLSGTGRLHDLFVHIEGMTPGEYKQQGQSLRIIYSIEATPFGEIFIASTNKAICSIQFLSDALTDLTALDELQQRFALAEFQQQSTELHQQVSAWFQHDFKSNLQQKIPLRLQGTPFQLKVWEALLKIPEPVEQLSTDCRANWSSQSGSCSGKCRCAKSNRVFNPMPSCDSIYRCDW